MKLANFANEITKMNEENEQLKKERDDWRTKYHRLNQLRSTPNPKEVEELEHRISVLLAELNDLRRDVRFEEKYTQLMKRHASLQRHFTMAEDKLNKIEKILGGN